MAAETETRNLLLDWLDAYVVGDSGLVECAHATVELLRGERDAARDLLHDMETTPITIAIQEREEARDQMRALLAERQALQARLREHEETLAALRDELAGERAHVRTLQQELETAQGRPGHNGNGTGRPPAVDLTHAVVRTVEAEKPAKPGRKRYGQDRLTGRCVDCGGIILARSTRCRSCQARKANGSAGAADSADSAAVSEPVDLTPIVKRCKACEQVLPLEAYYSDGRGGKAARCKQCVEHSKRVPVAEDAVECVVCKRTLPPEAFYPSSLARKDRRCKECHLAYSRRSRPSLQRNQPAHDPTPVTLVPEVAQNHVTTKPASPTRQERIDQVLGRMAEQLDGGAHITQELLGAWSVDYGLPICDIRTAYDQALDDRKAGTGKARCECGTWYRIREGQTACAECTRITEAAEREAASAAA